MSYSLPQPFIRVAVFIKQIRPGSQRTGGGREAITMTAFNKVLKIMTTPTTFFETIQTFFIVGTGRSGTHFLADSIAKIPEIKMWGENTPSFFFQVVLSNHELNERAVTPDAVTALRFYMWYTYKYYRPDVKSTKSPAIYLEKANILQSIPELTMAAFPKAKFIRIIRDGRDAVASMVHNHPFIRLMSVDPKRHPEYGLGIRDKEDYDFYLKAPLHVRAAVNWRGKTETGLKFKDKMPSDRLLEVRYEDTLIKPHATSEMIHEFLGTNQPANIFEGGYKSSVGAYKNRLSKQQIDDICEVINETNNRIGYDNER